ncbi:hypothetical protein PMJ71_005132, partial [Escherichia coli]|nr:hypothetical protein [Escherichia coli]
AVAATPENKVIGDYTIEYFGNNGEIAKIIDTNSGKDLIEGAVIDTGTGKITTVNKNEVSAALDSFIVQYPQYKGQEGDIIQIIGQELRYSIPLPDGFPSLKLADIENLTPENITAIKQNVESVAKVITTKTAADYNQAVSNGMSSEAALAAASSANGGGAMLHEFNRIGTNITNNTKAIQSNSRQLQEHNARLNDHQRQIRENHEEMKRAAAQSAALAGLFQPYSVGKFN